MKKLKKMCKRFKGFLNDRGNDIVAVALVLLFLVLGAMGPLKKLGETVSDGINAVQTNMQKGFTEGENRLDD